MTLASGSLLSPTHLISTYGTIGIFLVIFAETGLLIGFFFPGDTLLFVAGAFSATHNPGEPHLNLALLLPAVAVAAVAGGETGYLIGRLGGEALLDRPDSRLFKQRYVQRTRAVLERYGETKAVLLARVIPVVRTFINPVMGVVKMPVATFTVANVVGGLVWSIGVTLLGYALGASVNIDRYILPITAVILVASLVPILLEFRKHRRTG